MFKSQAGAGLVAALAWASAAPAQSQDEPIRDNSFLVEEAYNQEHGVVQHVSTLLDFQDEPQWTASFTQEWPLFGPRHQLSYTLAWAGLGEARGRGDAALHYRWQLLGVEGGRVAFAPRLSLLVPSGDAGDGLGAGSPGVQVNLPVSVELGARWVGHWNVGGTWTPGAEARDGAEADAGALQLGQGLVYLLRPRLNLLLEAVYARGRSVREGGGTERVEELHLSPGLRWALNRPGGLQVVPGIAVPVGVGPSNGEWSLFVYLSFEHPF
ncbi:MAG: transporter [Thermoanaerobaculia bacterium]|nr:MAG: transporter [Thermoanaerobaculia bacterium]